MMLVNFLQFHRPLAMFKLSHEAPTLVAGFHLLALCLKTGVKRREVLPEVFKRAIEE